MKKLVFVFLFLSSVQGFAQRLSKEIPDNSIIYALPKTSIEVSVEVLKDKYVPGPYVRYAEELLSIENVSAREDVSYRIGEISMKATVEADYEYLYSLPAGEKSILDASFLALSSEGLIFALNEPKEVFVNYTATAPKNYQPYPDRLPSSPLATETEFVMERIKTDSGFISIPFQQNIVEKKDIQSKAEEAAKFLFNLRKRRFELITGDVDHAFSGSSLNDALNEINRLEREYLSLFIGKHSVERRVYNFYVSPEKAIDKKSYPVFYFSEADGALHESTRTSVPFTLIVSPSGKINYIEGVKTKIKVANIYYRIPEIADVQLLQGSKEVCNGRMQIYQLGKELVLPADAKIK
ncbi:MAG: DUF4831 family protein [Prevotellaceae bacterium]|jgi:hypothetical protein|nr:DUF4831 family protein [Prevotellaceae bacterium]